MVRSSRPATVGLLTLLLLSAVFAGSPRSQEPGTLKVDPSTPKASASGEPARAKVAKGAGTSKSSMGGGVGRESILKLVTQANPMVWLLGLCSIVTLGFTLERMIALRRERVIPRDFVSRFLERLESGKLDKDRAAELCKANESSMARVFAMVVSYWGQPSAVIRQALGYDAAGELSDLKRNVRVLNGTATLAPLLGLLGTVIGMIQSFDALGGRVGPAKGEALAKGISLALVTTALGLGIAIVSVVAYYYLLNRVDVLVRDLDERARQAIDLVSAESIRPASLAERRPNMIPPGDMSRQESRIH
ncbi:MotA/TolQ/ExbB proton channel family protein [Singulisphaera sp. PoT]|uniref:MotA/TolQ/ExbB proton channel family protein n=1 Tax=Singulisphaera sp. PoT TaxID=3411797 RepID=UPI003BF56CF0